MPQDQDALRKVGRGGAGNYVSSKQAEEASKDLEAQELKAIASTPSTAPSQGPARAGRGGAGNFFDPTYAARNEGQLADETGAAVASRLKKNPQPHRAGWSGRGGAGNFNPDQAAENERRQEEERGVVAELDKKIKEAVEGALKLPEKAHRNLSKEEEEEEQ
ncbi:hypothetical protein TARUN_5045 [Trichoderma arundinaceum]|uniref:Uncharacterized protein n=1 Tax=Trichoderma arundinaceum TaxID=490622 RepID=A0A395NM95_TRIAR|nr:hypothetical protein TARUN_5045 [Trichoderma arundinaceum]